MTLSAATLGAHPVADNDLAPLAWVLEELRKTLDGATKAVRRYVRDVELNRGTGVPVEVTHLRVGRQQLHQAQGALAMVGLGGPAKLLQAMEAAVDAWLAQPDLCQEAVVAQLERSSFALTEFLDALLKGRQVSAVALFVQYRWMVEASQQAGRLHPADLWELRWHWADVAVPPTQPLAYEPALRDQMNVAVLSWVKTADVQAAQRMSQWCAGLAVAQTEVPVRTFWAVAGAYFEAQALGLCPQDVYSKRVASQILNQYAALAKGQAEVSERVAQDALFFTALQPLPADVAAPLLRAVHQAYDLTSIAHLDYEAGQYGRHDPAALQQARKRIATAAETWSAFAGGDDKRVRAVVDHFASVTESMVRLDPQSEPLARALTRVMDTAVATAQVPTPAVAMEVATTILYLQAAYEDLEPSDAQTWQRQARLIERLDHVLAQGAPEAMESWMEELYRRVSDRQTMGSVVSELRGSLDVVEKSLDQFFRNPADKDPLREVPNQLGQMRGVFSVLGLDQPAVAALRMRASVEQFLIDEIDPEAARSGIFEKIGNSLGAMGFLIDMLGYQRELAKKLFVYDEMLGELKSLMGRERAHVAAPVPPAVEPPAAFVVPAPPLAVAPSEPAPVVAVAPVVTLAQELDPVPVAVPVPDEPLHVAVATGDESADDEPEDDGFMDSVVVAEDDDAELLDIFLEEARDVIRAGFTALDALAHDPEELAEQVILRRTFHTLKGSSRMVGLNEFGEAAWSYEQLLNAWLAEQRSANHDLMVVAREAMQAFDRWVDDVAARRDVPWSAADFRTSADGLRLHDQVIPLHTPGPVGAGGPARVEAPLADALSAPEAVDPDPALADLHFDFSDTQPMVQEAQAQPDAQAAAVAMDLGLPDFDFSIPAPAAEPVADPVPVAEPVEESVVEGLPDLALPEPGPEAVPVPEFELDVASALTVDELSALAEPEPAAVPEALQPLLVEEPVQAFELPGDPAGDAAAADALALPPVALEPVVEVPPPVEPEQVKVIGHLRLSIPLYNVYLNEADEWSRRLQTELGEWALQWHQPLPDSVGNLAHSLLGGSATVGFASLSELARVLERALLHVQLHNQGCEEYAQTFNTAAEEIRRLLHQFAAGFYKEADPQVLAALEVIVQTTFEVPAPQLHFPDESPQPLPAAAAMAPTPLNVAQAHDNDIDVEDHIDVDLLPFFEEEATDLLPKLSTALRRWVDQPDSAADRNEVLRVLHTLKGSARLAGAMRLGEMAHRMESSIEEIGADQVQSVQLEPLLTRFDDIQADYDALTHAAASEQTRVEEPAPVALAAAPVARAPLPVPGVLQEARPKENQSVRVRSKVLDRLVGQVGEVLMTRARMDARITQWRTALEELGGNLERLRQQLRDMELQAESQMQSRQAHSKEVSQNFDPLEFDRFTRVQELTRMMAESVNDVATVQRNLRQTLQHTEDDLIEQGRQARELQRDLLRTRMVEFESLSERLYGVVRQAAKDAGKQVKLDITGGSIEVDRGILERMSPVFEHLLRNAVAHGIEPTEQRVAQGKEAAGTIVIAVEQHNNDVVVAFRDDGGGLHLDRIRAKAQANGLLAEGEVLSDADAANLIFMPGFSTADKVTELAGRGIGMDVVRSEVTALGGVIETETQVGAGTTFKLVLPLTTAVTQVVMLRVGEFSMGVPASLFETVLRVPYEQVQQAYASQVFEVADSVVPFFWAGALLQVSAHSAEEPGKSLPVAVIRSAGQRIALHVDEVLGNREVVVKNLGPQLARLPGLAGMSVLASGAVALIYNPVALAAVYGEQARQLVQQPVHVEAAFATAQDDAAPLILVVDDSITVRRVTQRLLKREGYRVEVAADGAKALEMLKGELPSVVLSDIEMPVMDGFEMVRKIRADGRWRDLPVIMITSRIADKHRELARELGVDHYLGKPYSEDELLALLRDYCAAQQAAS